MSALNWIYARSPVALQTVFLNAKAAELYAERYGRKFRKLDAEFEKNQWASASELVDYQNQRLQRLVAHAYDTVPYYRETMDRLRLKPSDITTGADLPKLPVLTRETVRTQRDRLVSSAHPRWRLRHGHTSGTTGSPLDFYYDIAVCVAHHAADWRQKRWAGLRYGEPYASLQGRVIAPIEQQRPPFWRQNYINNQLFLSSFHLSERNIPLYLDAIARRGIKVIEGYPSTIYILALYLMKTGETFPLKAVLTSSETLFEHQREAIEKVFRCKVFDFYGMAERVVFAGQCGHGPGHHLNLDYGITEYIADDGARVGSGRPGRIVATGLHNFAMPLIRYQTGDIGAVRESRCACGRSFPLTEDVTTKNESIVTLPDGRLISPSVLTHPFKPMHNIAASQLVQTALDELVVKIVKRPEYCDEDEATLVAAFRSRLGAQMKIRLDYVADVSQEPSGKFRWVISKVPTKF